MQPVVMTADDLAEVLEVMAKGIRSRDSFEGNFAYTCIDAGIFGTPGGEAFDRVMNLKPGEFLVQGTFRIGNSHGQGGMHVVGEVANADNQT